MLLPIIKLPRIKQNLIISAQKEIIILLPEKGEP